MKNLFFLIFSFLLSLPALSQNLKSTCVRYDIEFQCMDFGGDLFAYQLNDLTIGKDFIYFEYKKKSEMTVNNSSKSGATNIERNEQRSREFGEGVAYAFTAFFDMLPRLTFDSQMIKDNFMAIDSRVDDINALDKAEVNRALNSLPDLFKMNRDGAADISNKLKAKEEEYRDLDKKLDDLCRKMDCSHGGSPSVANFSRQDKYQFNNDLLTNKRDELQRTRESSHLPLKTIDNIYVSSGLLQAKANEAFLGNDLDTAESVQAIATEIVNFGLDLTPIVSDVKGLYEAIFAENPLTGEKLDSTDRSLSAVSSLIGIASLGTLGAASKVALKSATMLESFAGAKSALVGASRIMDKMSDMGIKKLAKAKDLISTSIGKTWLKVQNSGRALTDNGYKIFDKTSPITNPFPSDRVFAKVLERKYAEDFRQGTGALSLLNIDPSTGLPIKEAFITAAEELKGLSPDEIVKKLSLFTDKAGTIPRQLSDHHVVVEFRMKDDFFQSISSPVEIFGERGAGFLPGGRTAGGAREWLIDSEAGIKGYVNLDSVIIRDL